MHKETCALHFTGYYQIDFRYIQKYLPALLPATGFYRVFASLPTGAGRTGDAMSASAATLIATGKAPVTPTVNANATSAAGPALEGGATVAAGAGAAAGGRAETGEVRRLHAGISCMSVRTHVVEGC